LRILFFVRLLTPLHMAVFRREQHLGIVKTLLANVGDAALVNGGDAEGLTPLHHAVLRGWLAAGTNSFFSSTFSSIVTDYPLQGVNIRGH